MEQLLKSICLCVAIGMVMSCNIFKTIDFFATIGVEKKILMGR